MKNEFSPHIAYWNPHYGACRVYPGPEQERGVVRFSPLGEDNRGTYDMRFMPLEKACEFLIPIPGCCFDHGKMAFVFDEQSTAFIADRALKKAFKGAGADPSSHDPFWMWEHGRQQKALIAEGRDAEASAANFAAGTIHRNNTSGPRNGG